MATYQGAAFLREQLQSIQKQTLLPSEIVISDDHSTDRTLEIVGEVLSDDWCRSHGVSLVIRRNEKALGPGKNFEQAIMACSGQFVGLCDQDDVWPVNKLERLVGVLQDNPHTLLVHTDARLVDAAGRPLGMKLTEGIGVSAWERETLLSGHSLPAIIRRNLATGATVMIRRVLADIAFPLPAGEIHDTWLALVASSLNGLMFIPEELLDYRQHERNEIGATPLTAERLGRELFGSWRELQCRMVAKRDSLLGLVGVLGDRLPPDNRKLLEDRIMHLSWRTSLPSSRIFRVWPVLAGFLVGRYRDYGRQPHDVIRDLVMPPREVVLSVIRSLAKKPGN